MLTPEQQARENIDKLLEAAGWKIQDMKELNIFEKYGIAVREFPLKQGHGFADYMLYVGGEVVGVVEAKKEGETLTGVENQSDKYTTGIPEDIDCFARPLPFSYQTTGVETRFINHLQPDARSRPVFAFHTPDTLALWAKREKQTQELLQHMPPLDKGTLRPAQIEAINNLEQSLADNRPRSLIQMATGSGKTYTSCNFIYRLIKHGGAKRVLFLVDRGNLGKQAFKEFSQFEVPGDGRKFTELYNVQRMSSNKVDHVSRVNICTIQRMFSMLSGSEVEEDADDQSMMMDENILIKEPKPIEYNKEFPIEMFDYIVVDECHRSIYNLWRQILEYFDAKIIGLTATPSMQTIGFFHKNLVMEYNHQRAVADGVNVDFMVYKIETEISQGGSKVDSGYYIDKRDKLTRKVRYHQLDDDLMYEGKDLDRSVVALDQIRTVIRTFKENMFTEIFPGRSDTPKTLIFAKDDNHAEDIVKIVREEFGKGNDFCQKITYKTHLKSGQKIDDLIQEFRNSYNPRIAVTVDMIATGTDIKSLECVFFMRNVKSLNLFEQMKGRGVRVMKDADYQSVTKDSKSKTHFVLVDAVGLCEQDRTDTKPLDVKPGIGFEKLLKVVSMGNLNDEVISTLVSRLARLNRTFSEEQHDELQEIGGLSLESLNGQLIEAIDEDVIHRHARAEHNLTFDQALEPDQIEKSRKKLAREALKPLYNPKFREALLAIKKNNEQIIDTVSIDTVTFAGFDDASKEKAQNLVDSFKDFLTENQDELELIKAYYQKPFKQKVSYEDVKKFYQKMEAQPLLRNQKNIREAFATLNPDKVVKEDSYAKTDVIPLIEFAGHQLDLLQPYRYLVTDKYEAWLEHKAETGEEFTEEQVEWLELMKDEVANNLGLSKDDFAYGKLVQKGGFGAAWQVFGERFDTVVEEMNGALV